MTTLQECLNQKFPTKESKEAIKKIDASSIGSGLDWGKVDLSEFLNLEEISFSGDSYFIQPLTELILGNKPKLKSFVCRGSSSRVSVNFIKEKRLTKLDFSNCPSLEIICCSNNLLTSVDFLNQLPNPEKLKTFQIYNNNIQSTDISTFSKFTNLRILKIGTTKFQTKQNKFYGSLKSYQNLTNLQSICIEATDVNEGLEYLPMSLAESTAEEAKKDKKRNGGYFFIECSPHNTNAKCSQIQNKLRPFNYDLEAWQLAHPHLMYKARPEIFFDPQIKHKWLSALRNKINHTQEKLNECKKTNKPEDAKRIKRLEMKLDNLKLIQENISNHSLIERLEKKVFVEKKDKSTQTEHIIEPKK